MVKLLKNFKLTEWLIIVFILGCVAGQVFLDLRLPDYMGRIVEKISLGESTKSIINTGALMLLVTGGSVFFAMMISFFSSLIAARLARNVREKIFEKVNSFSMEELNRFSTASLITRSTNDITQVQTTVTMFFRLALYAPAMAIGAVLKIINKNQTLTLITGGAILVMLAMISTIIFIVIPRFSKIQKQTDKINSLARENLTGIRVVRAYNAENSEKEKFEKTNEELTKTNLTVNRAAAALMPGMQLIMMSLSLAISWVGAYIVNKNPMFFPDLTIFSQYAIQVLFSFIMLTMLFVILPRGIVSAKRINAVLSTKIKITDGTGTKKQIEKGEIEFKNVNFRYPEAENCVLKNINLKIEAGQTVAFIGSTGSGKSTLINLITRFYDASEGEVLIDGENVKNYKLKDLYTGVGYVPQKGVLFSGTIEENIKFGKENASQHEVENALKIAQAKEFVDKLETKTQHHIAQGGKNVSGGQKQRLSIARAIIKKPKIYIFDDSFSALDYKTDVKLRTELKNQVGSSTCIIVAQRIGTILNANKIVVMENGEIVGMGTHKQLLKNCKVYKEIALSQLSEEELKHVR